MKNIIFKTSVLIILAVFLLTISISIFNFSSLWTNQISVTGFATKQFENEIAEFSIVFESQNKEVSVAESENNQKVANFLEGLKSFNIKDEDITTLSVTSYQKQELDKNTENYVYTDWVYSQSIKIKIKNIEIVESFNSFAAESNFSYINGPNFSVDTENLNENEVYTKAYENAYEKAKAIAEKSGRNLGKALYISEGYQQNPNPIIARFQGGGGAGNQTSQLPSGSSEISKSLNIIFELK